MSFLFKEIHTQKELKDAFLLRQRSYAEDNLFKDLIKGEAQLDIDEFDAFSYHFGCFHKGRLIAYLRLVMSSFTPCEQMVNQIYMDENETIIPQPICAFPFVQYFPDHEWSHSFLTQLCGKNIGEVGKLCIHPDYRKHPTLLDELLQHFIQFARDEIEIETGFGICTLILERYYRKFGFYRPDGSMPFGYKNLPEGVLLRFDP